MIRSRLIFILLLLAYLGVTPAGMYTCACLIPTDTAAAQVNVDEFSVQSSLPNPTAVAALLTYLSLTFIAAASFLLVGRQWFNRQFSLLWLKPYRFFEPPPTPPPHFS